eukprot:tig00000269_g23723.t1
MSRGVAESLRSSEHVKFIVPDAAVSPAQAVDFTALGYGPQPWGDVVPWHLDRLDQASGPLDGRFDRGTVDGTGVDIYVVDTGVLETHSELAGRVIRFYDVDSALYNSTNEHWASDCSSESHGTAVAAAAAGLTFGAAPGATVLSGKVYRRSGSAAADCPSTTTDSDVLAGLEQVLLSIQSRGRPSVTLLAVTSTSSGTASALYTDVVSRLRQAGSVVITAAGNDNADACDTVPGNTPGAINVGASDQDDYPAGFSNYGRCISLFAPGQNIQSALRMKAVPRTNGRPGFTATTGVFHGTSFAAGVAAGVAALYRQALPAASLAAIEDALVNGSVSEMRSSVLNGSLDHLLSVSRVLLHGITGTRNVMGPATVSLVSASNSSTPTSDAADREQAAHYIVVLHEHAEIQHLGAVIARGISGADGDKDMGSGRMRVRHVFRHAFLGFSASISRAAAESLRSHEHVKLVVPDATVSPAQAVDFTAVGYGPQPWGDVVPWHLDRLDQQSRELDGRFDRGTVNGSGVDIYVVDTGVLATHSELEGRVIRLYDVDSALYTSSSENWASDCARSPDSHGTAVAAAAAGRTFGVAPGATVLSVKVFRRSGGVTDDCPFVATDSDTVAGLEQVLLSMQSRGRPSVTLITVETTSRGSANSLYTNVIARLRQAGSVVITAAGNGYFDACDSVPGNTPGVINVGASDQDDYRAGFSNYGSCISLFAPGQNVRSALRPKEMASANGLPGFTANVGTFHGTAFAAGIVAGVAALYRQALPAASLAVIEDALVNGAVPMMRSSILNNSPNRLLSVSKVLLPGATGTIGPAAYDASLFSGVEIGMCSFTPNTTVGRPSALHRQLLQWGDAYFDVASEPAKATSVFLARLRVEQD